MSDEVKDFKANIAKEEEEAKKRKELQAKELILRDRKANLELARVTQAEEELAKAKSTNYGAMSEEAIANLRKQNIEYIEAARNGMKFINNSFKGVVPYFRKNLLLILGKTGEGKSTTVANIVRETLRQINPLTGKGRRVLVITNEERSEDVYNRITCLAKGWAYTNHDKFTQEQLDTFDEWIPKLAAGGRMTVIDNNYEGNHGVTTTIEGIEGIFDNLIRDKQFYDVVIIDYYQNIKHSKLHPHMTEFEVQARLANSLDRYKNEYPAPIVVMAQVLPPDKDKKVPVEHRIKGRKIIVDPATLIMEMVADRQNLRTEWIIHKSRFTEAIGASFFTGYDKGAFVEYNQAFIDQVHKNKIDRLYARSFGEQVSGQPSIELDEKDKK